MSEDTPDIEPAAVDEPPPPPHPLSMAAWDVPAPAVVGRSASVKIGVQCEHGCDLLGQPVTLHDASGTVLASGVLDRPPAAQTEALYWTELPLPTPTRTGVAVYSAACPATDMETPHLEARGPFSFRTDPRPEHKVTVRVVAEATGAPVEGVEVRMNHYAAYTDAGGQARFDVPGGAYECSIRKLGYKAPAVTVTVAADLAFEVLAGKGETREELEARLSAWEAYPWV